jgi:hypothetical protein
MTIIIILLLVVILNRFSRIEYFITTEEKTELVEWFNRATTLKTSIR